MGVDNLRMNGFEVIKVKHFDIRYKKLFVNAQIDVCKPILEKLANRGLALALKARAEALHTQALGLSIPKARCALAATM